MDYYRRVLIDYEKQVLSSLPNPFGSFEKAKYVLRKYRDSFAIYSFVTTSHNTEDCVNILKKIFDERYYAERNFTIWKHQNGEKELLYTHKPNNRP